ncbi:MAG: ABC transporter ATP-binding protein [Cytophagales bacterium]|nr:ABC transporter ATP-binding protein [Cytophagales bacterium]
MERILECRNLTHHYGERLIYENLNFSVEKGKILGLLGKNGTGKTTTINILTGYLQPTSGECLVFGQSSHSLTPEIKARIGFLIEGHIQYDFMNIFQIEKFYSQFYPNWKREPYFELMSKLKISPKQKIQTMSCGQRSQVALGLILAQDPEFMVLDDFSMGLDPGYRRLFIEYLQEYAKAENKTIFTTSHIIQDMERLIDDCLIMDYNRVLVQSPVSELLGSFRQFTFSSAEPVDALKSDERFYSLEEHQGKKVCYSFLSEPEVKSIFESRGIHSENLEVSSLSLEDAFIGLTGKY